MSGRMDYLLEIREKNKEYQLIMEIQTKDTVKDIVNQLIVERKRLGLTQQDIADATGMKAPNITRLENHHTTPTIEVLMRYADAIGMKLELNLNRN